MTQCDVKDCTEQAAIAEEMLEADPKNLPNPMHWCWTHYYNHIKHYPTPPDDNNDNDTTDDNPYRIK